MWMMRRRERSKEEATNELQEDLKWWKKKAIRNYSQFFNGDVQTVEKLCSQGANLLYLERERGHALATHVFYLEEVIRYLVDRGADVNSQDENGDTALHLAIRHARYDGAEHFPEMPNKPTIKMIEFI